MKTLNIGEAAAFLHLHPVTLKQKARAGEIPGAKPGKCWVFIDVDLADWLRSQYRSEKAECAEYRTLSVTKPAMSGTKAERALQEILAKRLKLKTPRP